MTYYLLSFLVGSISWSLIRVVRRIIASRRLRRQEERTNRILNLPLGGPFFTIVITTGDQVFAVYYRKGQKTQVRKWIIGLRDEGLVPPRAVRDVMGAYKNP